MWLVPTKVNQGCYDALQLLPIGGKKDKILRVVQVTIATSHPLKMEYVETVLTQLGHIPITRLDVVIIVKHKEQKQFVSAPPSGVNGRVALLDPWKGFAPDNKHLGKLVRVLGFKQTGFTA